MIEELINSVEKSLIQAQLGISKLDKAIFFLNGMSSPKIRQFLNNLCERPKTAYLETGCWRGSTLVSALYNNHTTVSEAIAIDNFSEFQTPNADGSLYNVNPLINMLDKDGRKFFLTSMTPKQELLHKTGYFLQAKPDHYDFYDGDCFSSQTLETLKTKHGDTRINTYLYDGAHDSDSQYKAFADYDFILDQHFIAIVNDWNAKRVKSGTHKAFDKLGYKVKKDWHMPSRGNGDIDNWWNGLYVAVVQKSQLN